MNRGLNPYFNPTQIELYESPLYAFADVGGDSWVWTHGLNYKLHDVVVDYICVAADAGYAVGDEARWGDGSAYTNATTFQWGYGIIVDLDSVTIQGGSDAGWGFLLNKTTGTGQQLTHASWKLRIRGKRIVVGDVPDITTVGMVPLASGIVLGESSLDLILPDLGKYQAYRLEFSAFIPVTNGAGLWLASSSNLGVSFDTASNNYSYVRGLDPSTGSHSVSGGNSTVVGLISSSLGNFYNPLSGHIDVYAADLMEYTYFKSHLVCRANTSISYDCSIMGIRFEEAIVNAIQLIPSTGNILECHYTLSGMRKAA